MKHELNRDGKKMEWTRTGVMGGRRALSIWAATMEKRADMGKSGRLAEKWTGSYRAKPASARLRPDKSTQVVDFPHLAYAGVFREVMKLVLATDGTQIEHGRRKDGLIRKAGNEENRIGQIVNHRWRKDIEQEGTETSAGGFVGFIWLLGECV